MLLVWATTLIVVAAALLSAFLGRANFGASGDSQVSLAGAVALVAFACAAVVVAMWLTRLLRHRS